MSVVLVKIKRTFFVLPLSRDRYAEILSSKITADELLLGKISDKKCLIVSRSFVTSATVSTSAAVDEVVISD